MPVLSRSDEVGSATAGRFGPGAYADWRVPAVISERPSALDLLLSRRSVAQLREPAPAENEIAWVLDAGMRAPDHGRLRPWQFVIIRGRRRQEFADYLVGALKQRDPDAPQAAADRIRILGVPLIIAVGARIQGDRIPEIEQLLSAGAAAANMLNAIHALGYGGMWVTGAHTYDRTVNEALGFSAPDRLIGFIYVGTQRVEPPVWPRPVTTDHVREWSGPV